jgi:hypothetical protein
MVVLHVLRSIRGATWKVARMADVASVLHLRNGRQAGTTCRKAARFSLKYAKSNKECSTGEVEQLVGVGLE